ncbi:MAG: class I SAM-dependent methyltransferase [Bacteroidota bacterium]
MKCHSCGLVQFTIRPTEKELIDHYGNYPVSGSLSEITKKRYSEILDTFEPFRKTGRILDIGCGEGFFLEEAKKRGWEVHGTEFSDLYIPICEDKGISMKHGRLDTSHYQSKSFDLITWFEVIEHINTPNEELGKFTELLRAGGAVYLTTPNIASLSRYILKGNWTAITYPDHLCYYSQSSLKRLFSSHGFSAVSVKTTGISIGRVADSLRKHSRQEEQHFHEIDRQWQERLEKPGMMHWLKSFANSLLDMTGKGDSLKALFRLEE